MTGDFDGDRLAATMDELSIWHDNDVYFKMCKILSKKIIIVLLVYLKYGYEAHTHTHTHSKGLGFRNPTVAISVQRDFNGFIYSMAPKASTTDTRYEHRNGAGDGAAETSSRTHAIASIYSLEEWTPARSHI